MKQPFFTGVCTALVTPFLDGKINYPMAEILLRRQLDSGVNTIVLAGTTGEAPTLTDAEKFELFHRCKSYVGDSCKIIAGTGSNSTHHAVCLSIAAQNAGVDGLLVVSPYYNKATPSGLYAHYDAISKAVDIPIIAYNVPTRTGVDIPTSVYAQLAQIDNMAGIKEASCDITKITKTRLASNDNLTIWTGNDDLIVPAISLGAQGVISVLSNAFPEETVCMVNAALSGDFKTAAALQCELQPIIEVLFCEVNPIPAKALMQRIGFDCGQCRLPLTSLTQDNYLRLSQLLK